jgi:hypothetical protein
MSGASTETDPALVAAIQSEQKIADEAATIRAAHSDGDDRALFDKLYPLCRRPIPSGFIVTSGSTQGKPYDSTGVKSVQVLFDRMDNVFGPLWWRERVKYVGGEGESDRGVPKEGRLAVVTIDVGPDKENPLFSRSSRGGVNQASTVGNLYKGTYTNAAKLAFARVGPGHEIYLGAADYDPDTNADAAKAQERSADDGPRGSASTAARPPRANLIDEDRARAMLECAKGVGINGQQVSMWMTQFAPEAEHDPIDSVATGVVALRKLTVAEADEFEAWLARTKQDSSS